MFPWKHNWIFLSTLLFWVTFMEWLFFTGDINTERLLVLWRNGARWNTSCCLMKFSTLMHSTAFSAGALLITGKTTCWTIEVDTGFSESQLNLSYNNNPRDVWFGKTFSVNCLNLLSNDYSKVFRQINLKKPPGEPLLKKESFSEKLKDFVLFQTKDGTYKYT